jgi:Ca-activated chloride channel homolog
MKSRLFLSVLFILVCAIHLSAQTMKVTGKVTDASNGDPLPGVSVIVQGTAQGAITDVDGKYIINCNPNDILSFAFVGYITEKIAVSGKSEINVQLNQDVRQLDEIVVIGYGTASGSDDGLSPMFTFKRKNRNKTTASAQANTSALVTPAPNDESYEKANENGFQGVAKNPLSTFSIDVDKAAYSNVRRFINSGQKPPADAVRVEEMINYFDYNYPQPIDRHPFAVFTEVSDCPWQTGHKLVHIGVQGKKIETDDLPPSNLVFLIDVSGSMESPNKLPLLKAAFKLLVNNLRKNDRVAIVTYASSTGIALESTPGSDKEEIINAIDNLKAGGSTSGGAGIKLAYQEASENFIEKGNNRIILATDGDFNVGASSDADMEALITKERESGIFLSCLGFGMGNYKDSKLQILADKGNGNHAYIDNMQEANKTLVSEFGGTLFTIAKDVKIQIEFNPSKVQAYRLVGYENRMLKDEDFKDDKKDAGELGSGHTVTVLYEIIPSGVQSEFLKNIPDLKYQKTNINEASSALNEVATIKMRYKKPDGDKSIELEQAVTDKLMPIEKASENLKFSTAVAMFGMLLKNSEFKGSATYNKVLELADNARSFDKEGYKAEFTRLVKTCLNLASKN